MNKKKEELIMAFSLDSKVKDILKNPAAAAVLDRSEEHTSELQSLITSRMPSSA